MSFKENSCALTCLDTLSMHKERNFNRELNMDLLIQQNMVLKLAI
jgi:hypothetical protein